MIPIPHIDEWRPQDPDALTRTGQIMGTPAYMAPEQFDDTRSVDQRADVFALGAVLYELVTGARAFGGDSLYTVYASIKSGRHRPSRELAPEAPAALHDAIARALAVRPEDRPASAEALRRAWIGDAPPAPPPARPRGPLVAALLGVGAVVGAAGWAMWPRAEATAPAVQRVLSEVRVEVPMGTLDGLAAGGIVELSDRRGEHPRDREQTTLPQRPDRVRRRGAPRVSVQVQPPDEAAAPVDLPRVLGAVERPQDALAALEEPAPRLLVAPRDLQRHELPARVARLEPAVPEDEVRRDAVGVGQQQRQQGFSSVIVESLRYGTAMRTLAPGVHVVERP